MTPNHRKQKEKTDKLYFIKIKNYASKNYQQSENNLLTRMGKHIYKSYVW